MNKDEMNFGRAILRPGLLAFAIAATSVGALVFMVAVVVGEARLRDAVSMNQWLARDIASQFSGVAVRELARAQKFGEFVRRESGSFEPSAQKEFDLDPSLKAVWVLDAVGTAKLQPLARLERDAFKIGEAQTENVRRLTDAAIERGSAARGILPGVNAIALKLGDMPRTIVLFFDDSLFSRASGGPWGDKWLLIGPSPDRTEAILAEATSELKEGMTFPSFDEISRLVTAQNPAQERSEFSSELIAANGAAFQVSGVQTGAFAVVAVAVTPLESAFASTGLLMRFASGIAISMGLLVMLIQMVRFRRPKSRPETGPETLPSL